MNLIELSEVVVLPNRQRRDFPADTLQSFSDGIAKRGLLHPIILRIKDGKYTLVAGERRLRAITDLSDLGISIRHDGKEIALGLIPYTLFDDLDPIAAEEAELEENINREDLTWQERAQAHGRLKELRDKQAAARGDPAPSIADLAVEVRGSGEGIHQSQTRKELIVAKHLHNPEVAAAKTVDEAFKVLKRSEETQRNRDLGESVGRTFTAAAHTALNEDSLAWIASCEGERFDCILTDPPYGMGADEFGDSGRMNMAAHSYKDNDETFDKCLGAMYEHAYRICKKQAHMYVFCDIDRFHGMRAAFEAAGWWVFRTPLIWHKPNGARAPWPENGPHRKWECILYAVKGKKPTTKLASDVLSYSNEAHAQHGAQKPVALFLDLLGRSVHPGDAVLDMFCGTGPIFPAAHALKCRATGIELDAASYGIAVGRIEKLSEQGELVL